MSVNSDRYPPADLHDVPEDIRESILAIQEKSGFLPNVFLKLARRPEEFRAFFAYYDALMKREAGLSKGEKEMIVVAVSGLNHCLYCVMAHGAMLRIYEKNPRLADQLAINWRKAELTPRQAAMIEFALKVASDSANLEPGDFAALHAHGFTDEDAWDIGAITAFFSLSNRMANVLGTMPNPEFYLLGRVPRG